MSPRSGQHRRRHSRRLYWKCYTLAHPCSCSEKLCAPTFSYHSIEPKVPNSWVRCNYCLLQCCAELQSCTRKHLPELEGFPTAESWQSSFHPPCCAQHKRREERAKSTACFIPAHPQPSQQVLVATGSQAQRQQPGCHKFQRGTSPVTCFIVQDQGNTGTAAPSSPSCSQLLGCSERPRPRHRS